jgi:hypothetical protein
MPARCSRARKPTGHRWGRVSGRSPSCLYVAIPEVAADGIQRLHETTRDGGTDWGLGIAARCGALLSEGDAAELLYREAIERFWRTRLRPELARAHLLYGEWLRREGRRAAAREQLHTAHEMFTAIGMEGFADPRP